MAEAAAAILRKTSKDAQCSKFIQNLLTFLKYLLRIFNKTPVKEKPEGKSWKTL